MIKVMKRKGRGIWHWVRLNPVLAAVAVLILTGAATTGAISVTPLAIGSSASLTQYGVPTPTPTTAATVGTITVTHTSARTLPLGQSFFDTARVSSPSSAPTGSVQFFLCGPSAADSTCNPNTARTVGSGPVVLTQGPLDTSTATSARYTPATVGVYCFAAVYAPAAGSNYVVSQDNVTAPADPNECVDVVAPHLSVVKSSVPPSGSRVLPGHLVTYTLTLLNTGSGLVSNATVIDHVPAGTIYVAGSASCGSDPHCSVTEVPASGIITWSGVDVAPETGSTSGTTTLSFEVTVSPSDVNNQVITNVASFTNEGTPSCLASMCATNAVRLIVVKPPVKVVSVTLPLKPVVQATTPPLVPVPSVTTVHTGKPWAGSMPFEIAALALGLVLAALGFLRRRRVLRTAESSDRT